MLALALANDRDRNVAGESIENGDYRTNPSPAARPMGVAIMGSLSAMGLSAGCQ